MKLLLDECTCWKAPTTKAKFFVRYQYDISSDPVHAKKVGEEGRRRGEAKRGAYMGRHLGSLFEDVYEIFF